MAGQIRHLLRRDGRYFARLRVPEELRPFLGWELREPLGADRAEALRRHPAAVTRLQQKIDLAREKLRPRKPDVDVLHWPGRRLTADDAARAHYADELALDEMVRDAPKMPGEPAPAAANAVFLPAYRDNLRRVAAGQATDDEAQALIGWAIDGFVAQGNLKLDHGSPEWRRLARTLAGVQVEALNRTAERDAGDHAGTPTHPVLQPRPVPADKADPAASRILGPLSTKTVDEIAAAYLAERGSKPATNFEYQTALRMLAEHFGEPRPIYTITRADIRAFKNALAETPSSYTKRFPDKTLPEAVKANKARATPFPTLSAHTINAKYLSQIHAVFAWAVRNDAIPDNPATGIKVDVVKATAKSRVNFSPDDLTRIFGSKLFAAGKTYGETQWAILLALFTGLRPSELAQVKLDSIRHERGVLVIAVEEETKNTGSQRLVPVHSTLLALGFEDRVKTLRQGKSTHLFPEWFDLGMKAKQRAQAKPGSENMLTLNHYFPRFIPKRFNVTFLPSIGITDTRKTFYGFRHTFKTGLALAGVDKATRDYLCGHADYSAGATYVHDVSIAEMQKAISRLNFDGFGLSNN